jgi:hypothetical protein
MFFFTRRSFTSQTSRFVSQASLENSLDEIFYFVRSVSRRAALRTIGRLGYRFGEMIQDEIEKFVRIVLHSVIK